jgi:hypothetical protein
MGVETILERKNIWILNYVIYLSIFAVNNSNNLGKVCTEKLLSLNVNHRKNTHNARSLVTATLKRRFGMLLMLGCIVLASVPAALCMSSAPIVYVSGDGSGDFNCDGKKDQVQINQALKFVAENPEYTTVYLKGPFTYRISDSLIIDSNTILEGDPTAVLTVHTSSLWAKEKPMIYQDNPSESTKGYIIIRGFEINGQADTLNSNFAASQGKKEIRGDGYYNMMLLYFDDVEVYNMYLHDSLGDGLKVKYSQNVSFHDNKIYKLGHDGLFAIKCNNVDAWNNSARCKTNSAVRIWNSNHVKIHDNLIYTVYEKDAGGPGIQIQYIRESKPYVMDDIEVYNNTIYDTYGPGIWLIAFGESYAKSEAQNVYIHNNLFYGCGTHPTYDWVCGIVTSGFNNTTIENNVFDGNYHAAVALQAALDLTPPGKGYTTIVRNNIISNTQQRKYKPAGTGNGVVNYLSKTHSFILENNCFYNNTGGDYKNTKESASDIHVDPLFADQANHDYHLKSMAGRWDGTAWVYDTVSSPCIDAGSASSDCSNEPEDNGDIINIGRYGNTGEASKSGSGNQ